MLTIVSVFNHFTRIAPPPLPIVEDLQSGLPSATASVKPKSRHNVSIDGHELDPSKSTEAERDITKLTGAEGGSDPTLTHDLLDRSREGEWCKLNRTSFTVRS